MSDVGCGVDETDWTVDGVPGSGEVIDLVTLGSHTVEYSSTDLLGNVEAKKTLELVVTRTSPRR